jgi:hypothetical protein
LVTGSSAAEAEIAAARQRVAEAAEKFERQQRRYAMLVLDASADAPAAKTLLQALEAELEAGRAVLEQLEQARRR